MGESENKTSKKVFGMLQGAMNTVKEKAQDIKLPEKLKDIKLPEFKHLEVKFRKIKLPEINLPFQRSKEEMPAVAPPDEIQSLSSDSALRIIYYVMAADGQFHKAEQRRFDEIGAELAPNFNTIRDPIVTACNAHIAQLIDPEDYFSILQEGISEAIQTGSNTPGASITPKILIWDLLTIAYSDGQYSDTERMLLKYVVRKLNVDKAVFLEMESSYLTLLDLENELAWVKTTDRPYLTIEAVVNEIADRKAAITDSIKDLLTL